MPSALGLPPQWQQDPEGQAADRSQQALGSALPCRSSCDWTLPVSLLLISFMQPVRSQPVGHHCPPACALDGPRLYPLGPVRSDDPSTPTAEEGPLVVVV